MESSNNNFAERAGLPNTDAITPDTSLPGTNHPLQSRSIDDLDVLAFESNVARSLSSSNDRRKEGSPKRDVLRADEGEWVYGNGGHDRLTSHKGKGGNHLFGGSGRDTLLGGRGDRLYGNADRDYLISLKGKGNNRLSGGGDNDHLLAKHKDKLLGNGGNDYLDSSQGKGKNNLQGGPGEDFLVAGKRDRLHGGRGADIIWSGNGKNRLKGGKGRDQFWIVDGRLPQHRNVIQDFKISQDFLGISVSNDIRRFSDLDLVQQGKHTLIQFDGKDIVLLKNVQAHTLESRHFLFDPVFVKQEEGAETTTTVTLVSRAAKLQNEMGIFFTDDAQGRIGDVMPGDPGYTAQALSQERRITAFRPDAPDGTEVNVTLQPNQFLGWYLIQDGTIEDLIATNPANRLNRDPIAFFSFADANPDGIGHLQYRSETELAWEDLTGGGDRSFDDLVFKVDFSFVGGEKIPQPPAPPKRPNLAVGDVEVTETNGTPLTAFIPVTLSQSSTQSITVEYQTIEGTAKNNSDYTSVSGTLTFAPGEVSKTIEVPIKGDTIPEAREQFEITLTNPINAALIDAKGTITITDNDPSIQQNQVPIADVNKTLTINEDVAPKALTIARPIDPDGDSLTITVNSLPEAVQGTVQLEDGRSVSVGQKLSLDELESLVFVPFANANGEAGIFSYSVEDSRGGSVSQSIALFIAPVNDAPSLIVPGAQDVLADTVLSLRGISISDEDVVDGDLELALSVSNGTLNIGETVGLTFSSGDGTADAIVVFRGTLAAINVALASLSYRSNAAFDGQDILNISVNDLGNTGVGGSLTDGKSVPINVAFVSPINTISGVVFVDNDSDSEFDASEVGQAGVNVFLDLNRNGFLNTGEPSQITDSDGQYRFEDVSDGSYLVWQEIPVGFEPTSADSFFKEVELLGDAALENVNFGNRKFIFPSGAATIQGLAWEDINADGIQNGLEEGLEEITIYLDLNQNRRLDRNEPTQVTGSDGTYRFTGLAAGSYDVRSVQKPGLSQTFPSAELFNVPGFAAPRLVPTAQRVILGEGEVVEDINFGNKKNTGEIRGQVWEDSNGNNVIDDGEPELAGITVYLDVDNDSQFDPDEASVLTNGEGQYRFRDLPENDYTVREVVPLEFGVTALDAPEYIALLAPGEVIEDINFGNQRFPDAENQAPEFISTPITEGTEDNEYSYQPIVIDPDNDSLTFTLLDGPQGLNLEPATGLLLWTPLSEQIGDVEITLQVSDDEGLTDTQTFTISVQEGLEINRSPMFISEPVQNFAVAIPNTVRGDVNPDFLNLSLDDNETFLGSVSISLPEQGDIGGSADIAFIIDESRSMTGEHDWLTNMVLELDIALEARGITDNRYSLIGYGGSNNDAGVRNITLRDQLDVQIYGPGNQLIDIQLADPAEFVLPSDGDYSVVLSNPREEAVSYDLSIDESSVDVAIPPSGLNEIISRSIVAGENQIITFDAPAGQRIWFDSISSTSGNIQGTLLAANGKIITTIKSDSDSGPLSLDQPGTYTLIMNGGTDGGDYSFQLIDMNSAPTMSLDAPITGTLDPATTKIFQLKGDIGQTVYFDSTTSFNLSKWTIYGPENTKTDSANIHDDLEVVLPADNLYWLVLENIHDEITNYQFKAITVEPEIINIQLNTVINGTVDEIGGIDLYTFEGQAGQGIWFDGLSAESIFGPGFELYTPEGDRLFFSSVVTNDSQILTLPNTGTYSLMIGGSDVVGDYSFQIIDADDSPTITIGSAFSGTLLKNSTQIYTLSGEAGQNLLFDNLNTTGFLPGLWSLYSPGNSKVLQDNRQVNNSLNQDFEVVLTADGDYHLVLTNLSSSDVDFLFQVKELINASVTPTGFNIVNGNSIGANETETFAFNALAGTQLWLDNLTTSSFSISANLTDPNGDVIFDNVRLASPDPNPYILETSGTYSFTVNGGTSGGDYSFRFLNLEEATPLNLDTPTDVALTLNGGTQLFQFEGTSGTHLFFDLDQDNASSTRGSWNLFYPGGGQANNIIDVNFRNDFNVVLPADGLYTLALENQSTEAISLRLEGVTPETQTRTLSFSETITGSLDEPGEIDRYTFSGIKGQKIWIDSLDRLSDDTTARLISPTGNSLFDDSGRPTSPTGIQNAASDQLLVGDIGPITLTEDGTYTLQIQSGDDVGNYSFRIDDISSAEVITDGDNLLGDISPSESQVFRFENAFGGNTLTFSPLAEKFYTNATQLSQQTEELRTDRGGVEDGYAALDVGLNLPFREDAARNLILITDESRDNTNPSLTFDVIRSRIQEQDVLLSTVINGQFKDENGVSALGVDANGTVYIPDDSGGFITSQNAEFIGPELISFGNTATIKEDYIDLVFSIDGAVWDLNQLREGGDIATSFTKAFVELQADEISEQFQIDVEASNTSILFENQTGTLSGIGPGETATFDIGITNEGTAESFEVLFTRPDSGFVLGSIPVVLNQSYFYPTLATDPDGDNLIYRLLQSPDDAVIDGATGAISWNPTAVGSYRFSVEVDDGRGGNAIQDFTVVVSAVNADNQAPTIISSPSTTELNANQFFTYNVDATDPDGDVLSYYITDGPRGLKIDPNTGEINWSPTDRQVGVSEVTIAVLDGKGKQATQQFDITVNETPQNLSPFFASSPQTTALPDETYQYQPIAIDPEGEAITYSLRDGSPTGMTIDATTGLIEWTPATDQEGQFPVIVFATDENGGRSVQSFLLTISTPDSGNGAGTTDSEIPIVSLGFSSNVIDIGEDLDLQVYAIDNESIASLVLEADGQPLSFTPETIANGTLHETTVQFGEAGLVDIVATATDNDGNVGTESLTVRVIDPSDITPPIVELDATAFETSGTVITSLTDIVGTISDENLEFYRLEIAPSNLVDLNNLYEPDPDYVVLAEGNTNIDNEVIGQIDPRSFANDNYFVRVIAGDVSGNINIQGLLLTLSSVNKPGHFSQEFVDLSIPLTGLPIEVTRTYNSFESNQQGDFGFGWSLGVQDARIQESVPVTDQNGASLFTSTPFKVGDAVTLTNPEGRRVTFTFEPEVTGANFFGPIWSPRFVPEPGVFDTLEVDDLPLSIRPDGSASLFLFSFPFNPSEYKLTTRDGTTYRYDQFNGLESVTDRNGNVLTYTDSGITSSTGQSITFVRDAQGRIDEIIDPSGKVIDYEYDVNGDLISVTDRNQKTTQLKYEDPDRAHYLTEIVDPLGRIGIRTEYNDQGQIERIIDANGNALDLDYDSIDSTQVVTDPFGNTTTFIFDERGNVEQEIDALGGITQRVFDDDNNLREETDPEGNITRYSYDERGNMLTATDPEGNTTSFTYNNFSQVLTEKNALGNITTNTYDIQGNLETREDAEGHITLYGYDENGFGLLTSITDANNNETRFEYDDYGNLRKLTDLAGATYRFTYDDNGNPEMLIDPLNNEFVTRYDNEGRVVERIDALNNVSRIEYNGFGDKIADIDALGNRTEYVYNDRGLLVATIFPDDTPDNPDDNDRITNTYDALDQLISVTNEAGQETRYEYDALGRQRFILYPDDTPNNPNDNPRIENVYDKAGRLIVSIDELGHRTTFDYDKAGNLILRRDALGYETRFIYDEANRLRFEIDALNRTTEFIYNKIGQQIEVRYADGTISRTTYDGLGNIKAAIDQEGNTTTFEYDERGRLIEVIDALDNTTTYSRDLLGNIQTQEDANGNVTTFEYDDLGQRTKMILPLGQESITTYDAVGNVKTVTDFNNETIEYDYDERNRLITTTLPDGEVEQFAYTPTGQLDTVTDALGFTNYEYDERDRLLSRENPDGRTIAYTYDDAGNILSLAVPSGTTSYTYDALNRIDTVTDPDGGETRYIYDDVGNLIQTDFANGVVESREYDSLNRLERLENKDSNGTVLSSYDYLLDAVGNRTQVTEADGRVVQYDYDVLYRLEQETIIPSGETTRTIEYRFDDVGNRLQRIDSVEGTTTYQYDENDRLFAEMLNDLTTEYRYDDDGNLTAKLQNGENQATYEWNAKGELIAVNINENGETGRIEYEYDHEGIRVSLNVNGEETRFLIDNNQQTYAQVIEEYTLNGDVQTSYVHGQDLISQENGGERSFYQVDGLGSSRILTNQNGVLTDTYNYDAFGQLIDQSGSTPNDYLFAGEQFDPNLDSYYLRARYYDPATGRFDSRDPFEGLNEQPLSLQDYIYGFNNPIAYVDPSGEVSILSTAIKGSVVLSLSGLIAGFISAPIDCPELNESGDEYVSATVGFVTGAALGGGVGAGLGWLLAGPLATTALASFAVGPLGIRRLAGAAGIFFSALQGNQKISPQVFINSVCELWGEIEGFRINR
ncbi:MAG: putative Ig domain-containing protein [Cyanobacteria bacterium P01_F01_bin.150]